MKAVLPILLILAGTAGGLSAAPVRVGAVEAELVAENETIVPGQPFTVALRLALDSPWHAYWINPGDSGLAPRLKWSLPAGFTAGDLRFPAPVAISTPPFMTYGLEGEVWLLTTLSPPADLPPGDLTLTARASWLICNDICVPGSAQLALTLPVAAGTARPHPARAADIARARERLPIQPSGWQFHAQRQAGRYRLLAMPPAGFSGDIPSAAFFPYDPGLIVHAAPQAWRQENGDFVLDLIPADTAAPPPESLSGVLVLKLPGSPRAYEIAAPFAEVPLPRTSTP